MSVHITEGVQAEVPDRWLQAGSVEEDPVKLRLEPFHAVVLLQPVPAPDLAPLELPVLDARARPRQVDVEVHAVDARAGVVLDPEVDVLVDAEAEAAILREVLLPQLVLLDLEALLEDLLGLVPAHGHVARDLLVAPDAEGPDREPRLGEDRLLLCELLQDLGCPSEPVATLADADVQHELLHPDLAHRVLGLVRHCRRAVG
mmetsp:Transcript_34448/g.98424  ORF Transcript_34448/g.98424 Transcript_34448/m.98424 type:complete len:202 (-) Transcript_34448:27-632(-)